MSLLVPWPMRSLSGLVLGKWAEQPEQQRRRQWFVTFAVRSPQPPPLQMVAQLPWPPALELVESAETLIVLRGFRELPPAVALFDVQAIPQPPTVERLLLAMMASVLDLFEPAVVLCAKSSLSLLGSRNSVQDCPQEIDFPGQSGNPSGQLSPEL